MQMYEYFMYLLGTHSNWILINVEKLIFVSF